MQFVRFGKVREGKFRETLGTNSFLKIDGRWSAVTAHQRCIDECKRRGFDGFQHYRGPSILDAKPVGHPALLDPLNSTKV